MAGELQKHVLEVWSVGTEVGDLDVMLRQTVDQIGHEIIPPSADRVARARPLYRLQTRECPESSFGRGIGRGERHRPFRAMPGHEPRGGVDVDDPTVLDDRDPIT